MAGTIVADTLTHSTAGSLTTDYVVNGSAKGWCHANQVSVGITDSHNVSSITDASTGLIHYTPISSMSDANYASAVSVRESAGGSSFAQSLNDLHTASRWSSSSKNNSNVGVDSQHNNIVVYGDLA